MRTSREKQYEMVARQLGVKNKKKIKKFSEALIKLEVETDR